MADELPGAIPPTDEAEAINEAPVDAPAPEAAAEAPAEEAAPAAEEAAPEAAAEATEEAAASAIHKGACFCGALEFEADATKRMMGAVCHCKDCRGHGGPFQCYQLFAGGTLAFTKGEATGFLKAEGAGNRRFFCGTCGTTVYMQQHDGSVDKVLAGSLPTLKFEPAMQFFCESATVDAGDLGGSKFVNLPENFGGSGKIVDSATAESTVAAEMF